MTDVLTFGETMLALRGSGPLKLGGSMAVSIAGAESNVAIGLARLGHAVRWAGAVGDDEAGQLVLRTLRAEGVDVTCAAVDPEAPTGLLLFEPRLPDLTRVHYYRDGSAGSRLSPSTIEQAFASTPRLLHLTGITPALGPAARRAAECALRLAREAGVPVCLDVNYRSRLWDPTTAAEVLGAWIPEVDILVASHDELPLVVPLSVGPDPAEQVKALLDKGVREVVVKLGEAGARVHTGSDELHQPARPVRVADPVGAGDAFVAGYLSALLDGLDLPARLDRATTTGAFAVASIGDWEGAPTRAELPLLAAPAGTVIR
ncbi:sugar kinase [Nocardia yunnanensis]|uniref:Sugar kinase n=1 Tax=Nocardia yunnanensis TaxID=2382165 RepID=A0A386ZHJ2_9NOCA|nr:sugar kinase [Nocardia yunnanensis]AYF76966.1 sugar kinase [Nocardia yunnanensis]